MGSVAMMCQILTNSHWLVDVMILLSYLMILWGKPYSHWDVPLRRNLQDSEVNAYLDLMEGLSQALPPFGEENRKCWNWEINEAW